MSGYEETRAPAAARADDLSARAATERDTHRDFAAPFEICVAAGRTLYAGLVSKAHRLRPSPAYNIYHRPCTWLAIHQTAADC